MDTLRQRLNLLAQEKPELRKHLVPLLRRTATKPVPAPTLDTDYSLLKKQAVMFGKALVQAIKKVARGARVTVKKTNSHITPGWEGGYTAVLNILPDGGGEEFNAFVTFNSADDGEMSGNIKFDGGGIIPLRTFGKSVEQWIAGLISEASSRFLT